MECGAEAGALLPGDGLGCAEGDAEGGVAAGMERFSLLLLPLAR